MGKEQRGSPHHTTSRVTRSGKEGGEAETNGPLLRCDICPKKVQKPFKSMAILNFHKKVKHLPKDVGVQVGGHAGHAPATPAAATITPSTRTTAAATPIVPSTSITAQKRASNMLAIDTAPPPKRKSIIAEPEIIGDSNTESSDDESPPSYSPMSTGAITPPVPTPNEAAIAPSTPAAVPPPSQSPQQPGTSFACRPQQQPTGPGSSSASATTTQSDPNVPDCNSDDEPAVPFEKFTPQDLKAKGDLYVCPLCERTMKNHNQYQMHMDMHQGRKPFKCEACVWAYETELKLMEHAMRDHGVEALFQCQRCQKKYKREAPFRKHRCH